MESFCCCSLAQTFLLGLLHIGVCFSLNLLCYLHLSPGWLFSIISLLISVFCQGRQRRHLWFHPFLITFCRSLCFILPCAAPSHLCLLKVCWFFLCYSHHISAWTDFSCADMQLWQEKCNCMGSYQESYKIKTFGIQTNFPACPLIFWVYLNNVS